MRFPFLLANVLCSEAVAFLNDGPFKTRILHCFNVAVQSNSAAIEPEAERVDQRNHTVDKE